jgi:hypothetical protein
MKLEVGVTEEASRHVVMERQYELFDVFQEIKKIFA